MPEEIEVPTEQLHETIHEAAHEDGQHGGGSFGMRVALSTAILAVVAAVAALLAGHSANEAVLEQIEASNQWNYYQSKSIKDSVLHSKVDVLAALNRPADPKDAQKLAQYKTEMEDIKHEAEKRGRESAKHMQQHVVLARAVTFFQIAIALAAVSVLTRKSQLWIGSLALGAIGTAFLAAGLL